MQLTEIEKITFDFVRNVIANQYRFGDEEAYDKTLTMCANMLFWKALSLDDLKELLTKPTFNPNPEVLENAFEMFRIDLDARISSIKKIDQKLKGGLINENCSSADA